MKSIYTLIIKRPRWATDAEGLEGVTPKMVIAHYMCKQFSARIKRVNFKFKKNS